MATAMIAIVNKSYSIEENYYFSPTSVSTSFSTPFILNNLKINGNKAYIS